jgi:hypothetical protein
MGQEVGELIEIMHQQRRGPGEAVTVDGQTYQIDAEGIVRVPPAAAEKLLQGAKWRSPAFWKAQGIAVTAATPLPQSGRRGEGRRVRTRDELVAVSEATGVPVERLDQAKPIEAGDEAAAIEQAAVEALADDEGVVTLQEPAEASDSPEAPDDAPAPQDEADDATGDEIVVSEDMTKKELLALAAEVGVQVQRDWKKADILAAFEADQD